MSTECAEAPTKNFRLNAFRKVPYSILIFLVVSAYLLAAPFNLADGKNEYLDADYGILTDNASRILNGQALYKDMWTVYWPAADHTNALILRVFGNNLKAFRVSLAITGIATALLLFYFASALMPPLAADAIVLFAFLLGPVCINFPYPSWFCIPLGLMMVLVQSLGRRKGSGAYYFAAGVVAGVIFCFKPNWGVIALAALLCMQCFGDILSRADFRGLSVKGAGAKAIFDIMILSLPVLSVAVIRNHLEFKNVVVFVLSAALIGVVGIKLQMGMSARGHAPSLSVLNLLCSLFGFAVVALPVVVYFLMTLGIMGFYESLIQPARNFALVGYMPLPRMSFAAALLVVLCGFQGFLIYKKDVSSAVKAAFFVVLGALMLAFGYEAFFSAKQVLTSSLEGVWRYSGRAFRTAAYVPLAAHLGMAFIVLKELEGSESGGRSEAYLLLSLWVYCVATSLSLYPMVSVYHLIWIMGPVILLGGVFLHRASAYWKRAGFRSWRKYMISACGLVVPFFLFSYFAFPFLGYFFEIEKSPRGFKVAEFADIKSGRAGILMPKERAEALSGVIAHIRQETPPQAYIFDMTGSYFYYLSDRRNPTRWGDFCFPGFLTPADIVEIKWRLEALQPRLVVTSRRANERFALSYPQIYGYIRQRYQKVGTFGEYEVFTLRRG